MNNNQQQNNQDPKADRKYQLFEHNEERKETTKKYELRKTTRYVVRNFLKVKAQNFDEPQQKRLNYASQARIEPARWEEQIIDPNTGKEIPDPDNFEGDTQTTKAPVYNLMNKYDEYTVVPALCQEIFYGFPTIVEINDKGFAEIVDEQLDSLLIEGEAQDAFLHFDRERKGIQNPLSQLSSMF